MLVIKVTSEPLEDNTQLGGHYISRDLVIRRGVEHKTWFGLIHTSTKVTYNILLDTKADRPDGYYEYQVLEKNLELPAAIHWLQGYRTAMEHQQK